MLVLLCAILIYYCISLKNKTRKINLKNINKLEDDKKLYGLVPLTNKDGASSPDKIVPEK